jgi:hypothetical protein
MMDGRTRGKDGTPSNAPLPLIFPVVLYCGSDPWDAPMTFEELVARAPGLPGPPVTLRYSVVNVRELRSSRLKRLNSALAGMFLFEKARHTRWQDWIGEALQRIEKEKDLAFKRLAYMFAYRRIGVNS